MKRLLLLTLAVSAAPALAAPKPLPPELRAMMPQRIVSLGTYELAPAPGAPKYLVHVWTAPRRFPKNGKDYPVGRNSYEGPITPQELRSWSHLTESPIVLDVFLNPVKPIYQTSITYSAQRAPDKISLRYFNSRTKQGLVFQADDNQSSTTIHTFFVFPYGLAGDYLSDTRVSNASEGGYNYYSVARGTFGEYELVETGGSGGMTTTTIFMWNGRQFAQSGLPIEGRAH